MRKLHLRKMMTIAALCAIGMINLPELQAMQDLNDKLDVCRSAAETFTADPSTANQAALAAAVADVNTAAAPVLPDEMGAGAKANVIDRISCLGQDLGTALSTVKGDRVPTLVSRSNSYASSRGRGRGCGRTLRGGRGGYYGSQTQQNFENWEAKREEYRAWMYDLADAASQLKVTAVPDSAAWVDENSKGVMDTVEVTATDQEADDATDALVAGALEEITE